MELSKVARPGSRLEVRLIDEKQEPGKPIKYYASRISDVMDNGDIEIYMPTDQGKMIVVQTGAYLELMFYTGRGMYTIDARVKDRYKDGGLILLHLKLSGELKRNQRREHYRYPCNIIMMGRVMDTAERKWLMERGEMVIMEGEPMETNTVADISGGGIKFSSRHRFAPESLIYCELEFGRLYKICCIILDVKEDGDNHGVFIHRGQFYGMDNADREELVKHIFDLELQQRKANNDR